MKIILITGRIGSGKSTVAEYLRDRGFQIINMDEYAKRMYDNWEFKFHVLKFFGPNSVTTLDNINTDFLKHNLFKYENKEYKKELELCILRYFRIYLKEYTDALATINKNKINERIIFIEAPETEVVINESKTLPFYSHKIVVRISDNKERFNRIFERNPEMTFMDIKERNNAQIDSELEEGDVLINNDVRYKYELFEQVDRLILRNEKHK